MKSIKKFIKEVKIRTIVVMSGVAFLLNYFAKLWLDLSQKNSLYPVPFFEGQLSFSEDKLEEYFSYMIEKGTFNIYIQTQFIDFLFLLSIIILHTLLAILLFKLICNFNGRESNIVSFKSMNAITKIAIINIIIAPFAGIADAIENFTLFIMFIDPLNVNNVLANIYSSLAAIKFTIFSISYLWFIFAGVYLLISGLIRIIKR